MGDYFFGFDTLNPSQQFFSHVGTIFCLPGLNQYYAVDKMSCLKKQDQTLPWTCVAGADRQCVNSRYAKFK